MKYRFEARDTEGTTHVSSVEELTDDKLNKLVDNIQKVIAADGAVTISTLDGGRTVLAASRIAQARFTHVEDPLGTPHAPRNNLLQTTPRATKPSSSTTSSPPASTRQRPPRTPPTAAAGTPRPRKHRRARALTTPWKRQAPTGRLS